MWLHDFYLPNCYQVVDQIFDRFCKLYTRVHYSDIVIKHRNVCDVLQYCAAKRSSLWYRQCTNFKIKTIFSASSRAALDQDLDSILSGGNDGKL